MSSPSKHGDANLAGLVSSTRLCSGTRPPLHLCPALPLPTPPPAPPALLDNKSAAAPAAASAYGLWSLEHCVLWLPGRSCAGPGTAAPRASPPPRPSPRSHTHTHTQRLDFLLRVCFLGAWREEASCETFERCVFGCFVVIGTQSECDTQ